MINKEYLYVWYEEKLVGKLWEDTTGKIGFEYEKSWIENGFPISQQLPLHIISYPPSDNKAHQFFANLLPEAMAREHIIRDLKITNTDYNLIKAIGGECAGALSITIDKTPNNEQENYKKLSQEKFKQLLLRRGQISTFYKDEKHPRLSLAGAQDKCVILLENNDYYLPQKNAASTHILKFEIADYRNIPIYEYFMTKLAEEIGMPVASIQLMKFEKHHYLLIERYDRLLSEGKKITRIHQEDFCQALGISYNKKYQQEGGPSFVDCYNLLKETSNQPIKDTENLLRWNIFNFLAGNSDAHAKNISLLYHDEKQIKLAPFYDLVCTRAVPRIDSKLAMSISDEYNPDKITLKHWLDLAEKCNINQRFMKKTLMETASKLIESFPNIYKKIETLHGPFPAIQRIKSIVEKQCKKTIKETS